MRRELKTTTCLRSTRARASHRASLAPTPAKTSLSRSARGPLAIRCAHGAASGRPSHSWWCLLFLMLYAQVTANMFSGTFLHELGHNLGLRHGSVDDVSFKVCHLSSFGPVCC